MDHLGHGLALDQAIFNRPHLPKFEWVDRERPKHYVGFTSPLHPKGVSATYRLAKFERDKPKMSNPTIVSHEGFFTDVPGFENFAEGNSAKMLGSLSLARQGRHFYWGYSIDPARMTDGAKDTLVNVLYYMYEKRGDLTVPFVCKTRKILRVYTHLGRDRQKPYMRGVEEHFPNQLVPKWRETYTPTFAGADAWVAKYLPYVFSGKREIHKDKRYKTRFEVDEDAMALGTPNAVRTSLERWVALSKTGKGEDRKRAMRCLERYVRANLRPEDGDWGAWYQKQKGRIVFVESAGFWWLEDPRVLVRELDVKAAKPK
jgi:hypothetical protein